MKSIDVVIKHPGELPYATALPDTLSELQRVVGGYVEVAMKHVIGGRQSVVWCDEEGLIKRPPPKLNLYRPKDMHPLVGGLVVTALEPSRDGMINASLTAREIALWLGVLLVASPQTLTWLDDPQKKAHAEKILHDVDGRDWNVIEQVLTTNGADANRVAARTRAVSP